MIWIIFALGAALSWGLYGPSLHRGQVLLGSPLRALLCVGVAYFLIGVLVPVVGLWYQGELGGFTAKGSLAAGLGGALGAILVDAAAALAKSDRSGRRGGRAAHGRRRAGRAADRSV